MRRKEGRGKKEKERKTKGTFNDDKAKLGKKANLCAGGGDLSVVGVEGSEMEVSEVIVRVQGGGVCQALHGRFMQRLPI